MISREASAKLATVMSHEGSHYNGNRVEALAHLAGAETYAFLNNKFTLQADTSFSMEMLSRIMNADNWKENTGDVDHWKMTWGGQLVSDGSGWLKDENGMYISKDGTRTPEPIPGETLGAEKQESGLLNIMNGESAQLYNTFSDEQKQQAQVLANQGYTVAGTWKNSNPDLSGHIATVEAGHEYKPETGPYFGNVGTSRYTGTGQKAIDAFGKDIYQSIKYYYDKDQFKNRRWY